MCETVPVNGEPFSFQHLVMHVMQKIEGADALLILSKT